MIECVSIRVYVCVYVCVRDGEREREKMIFFLPTFCSFTQIGAITVIIRGKKDC